ncbi:MAG TPA: hypothetical protein VF723_00565 [Pyrinomonadaceae bacterium]|jgi:hypothetical protein
MSVPNRSRNRALVRFILLPMLFLTVALLGGLRIDAGTHAFVFVPPPLITLIHSVLLMILFVRGEAIELRGWVSGDYPPLTNVSHVLTLLTLFFASAQAFNSVLPERGLLLWLFSFFFLWTLWNNLFSLFDARRLLRSLAVLFGTAFVLKHMLLAGISDPEGGFFKKLADALLQGISLGTVEMQFFAPATGYISFFTLALYVAGLALLISAPEKEPDAEARRLLRAYEQLSLPEREAVRAALLPERARLSGPAPPDQAVVRYETVETTLEEDDALSEETRVRRKPENP